MNIILLLLACSAAIGVGGLVFFLWALRNGQYDDLEGSANRILFDDDDRGFRPDDRRRLSRTDSPAQERR